MYREGPNGFNIPYGNYKNPKLVEEDELNYISELIQDVNFHNSDFSNSFENVSNEKNFLYMDPPYAPENNTSFVGYTMTVLILNNIKIFGLTKRISGKNMIGIYNSNVKLIHDNLSPEISNMKLYHVVELSIQKDPSARTEAVIITNY